MARDSRYDVVKGLAIVLMVVGHACPHGFVRDYIYLFHMPVFFIVAGWFYHRPANGWDACRFVWKRICRLWWPFVFWASVGILLHDAFVHWGIYTVGHFEDSVFARQGLFRHWGIGETLRRIVRVPFFMEGCTGMGAPYWFLPTFFYASVFYMIADFLLAKRRCGTVVFLTCVALVLICLGRYADFKMLNFFTERFGGRQMLTGFFLIHLGRLLRICDWRLDRMPRRMRLLAGACATALLCGMLPLGSVELVENRFPSVLFLALSSLAGWCLLCSAADVPGVPSALLAHIGRKTLPILFLHLYAFKLVSFAGIRIRHDPLYFLAKPVTTYDGFAWGIAYVVAGVALPLLADGIWYHTKSLIGRKCKPSSK